ncbi:MAG: chitobiase/beta-hexosaminidase C-terminal domain-containing protein, partial [Bacteroidales bacterium]|nr:chitobiase/beta-hexosaminidase C-terminal domain-containing protein [Bacteroidales bacterium]
MKKSLISILGALAVFAGCTKENENYGFIVPEGKELVKIIASTESSRTTVDIDDVCANYAWNFGDTLAVVEEDGTDFSKFTLVDAATGTFAGLKTEGKSLMFAVTPASCMVSGIDVEGQLQEFTISLPDFYDEYIPGTTNAVMFGTAAEATESGYKFQFRHAAAVVKVTYKNVPVGTDGLCLTMDKSITGSWTFDALNDVVLTTTPNGSNSVRLQLKEPVRFVNQTLDFYVPVPVGEYSSFEVALFDENFQEIIETKRSKNASTTLKRGELFATPVITLMETSLEGSYIIASKAATKGNWVVMQAAVNDKGRWLYDESEHAYTKEVNLEDSSVDFPEFSNISHKFDVIAYGDGYVLRNANSGDYVQFVGTSSNAGKEVPEGEQAAFQVFKVNANGTWTIGDWLNDEDLYSLQYNVSNYFSFYKSSQAGIYLIPYVGAATPVKLSGSCKNNVVTLTAVPSNAEIWYTVDGSEPDGTTPMTRYEEPFEITEDLTLKAIAYAPDETYTDSDVFVLECTYIDPSTTAYYEKVTKAPVDWSGEYLLVCENQNLALSSISSTSTKYGIGAEVSISNEQILSDPTTNAYKVVIAGATDNGDGYTLMLSDIYLAWTSGNSLTTANSESDNSRWTISAGATSGNWIIANVAQSSREIWYNTGSPRFACYENKAESTTGYAPIQLYKLSDSRQKLPTPEGLSVNDMTLSWNAVDGAASYNVVIGTLHDNTTESSYTFEGEAGYYNVSVIAVSGDGQYADSDPAILENAKFGTPTLPAPELSKGACTGTSVQVTWTADERATNGYQATLYVPGAPALDSQVVTEGSVTFDGLNAETTYTVQVYALAVEGEFPYAESEVSSIEVSTTQGGGATIADMVAACPSESYSLTGVTVVGVVSAANVLIGDGTGFALVYKSNHGLALGDVINVSGATTRYKGVVEFTQPAVEKTGTAPAVEYGDPVSPTADMMQAWAAGDFDITYIQATGTQSGRNVTLANGYVLYLHKANAATDGKGVSVSGLVYGWDSGHSNF